MRTGNWDLCCRHLKFEVPVIHPGRGGELLDIILWNWEQEINLGVISAYTVLEVSRG